jgi:hypothetical protein
MKSNYQQSGTNVFLLICLIIFPPKVVHGINAKSINDSQEGVHSVKILF